MKTPRWMIGLGCVWISCFLTMIIIDVVRLSAADGKYDLSENQKLRLELQQSRFQLAQEHYQQAAGAFNSEVKAIEKENSWPDDLQFDPNSLTFRALPKPPAPESLKPEPTPPTPAK